MNLLHFLVRSSTICSFSKYQLRKNATFSAYILNRVYVRSHFVMLQSTHAQLTTLFPLMTSLPSYVRKGTVSVILTLLLKRERTVAISIISPQRSLDSDLASYFYRKSYRLLFKVQLITQCALSANSFLFSCLMQ